MSDSIFTTMTVTANGKTATGSRMISRSDQLRSDKFDFIDFEFEQLSAPLKDVVIPLLDDRYDGPVTIDVEARDGDKVVKHEKTVLNSTLKRILVKETQNRGLIVYGYRQFELVKQLVDVLFGEAAEPVKRSLKEDLGY